MMANIKYTIKAEFSINPLDFGSKEIALRELGKQIDRFTNQYGGIITHMYVERTENSKLIDRVCIEVEAHGAHAVLSSDYDD